MRKTRSAKLFRARDRRLNIPLNRDVDTSTIITIICAVITSASIVCASTSTPDPNTTWGRIYRVIEFLGLLIGKAKEDGLLPPK